MSRLAAMIGAVLACVSVTLTVLNGTAYSGIASAQAAANCGLSQPAFCETFDAPAGTGNRSGQLNGTLWGVSRSSGAENFPSPANGWGQAQMTLCGSSRTVAAENDIFICNGQLVEGQDDDQTVTSLAMYPKQPFDFAGRTGKVTFDVSNDSGGSHAAWPEFWISDQPVPHPFTHEGTLSLPRNGLGIRFAGFSSNTCPEGNGYVGVDSAVTVANYVANDTFNGGNLALQGLDCVKQPTSAGQMNHYEIDVSQNQIDVFGTDAGTSTPLKHLSTIKNANLNFTRGLIWIEDAHYNGGKFGGQGTHSFTWDNVGFDGPVLPRDLAYDVNDSLTSAGVTDANTGLPVQNLGWFVGANTTKTVTVNNVANPSTGTGALLTFGFWHEADGPFNINYSINGHAHTQAWPFPTTTGFNPRTLGIPLNLAEVQAGTNTISFTPAQNMNLANIDLILVGAGGTVSPGGTSGGSGSTATPTATSAAATATPTSTTSSATATPTGPVATPASGGSGCQFTTAAGATAAFCEALSGGAQGGGRAGDLNDSKWSVSRFVSEGNTTTSLFRFPSTPASACKSGVSSTTADNDILVCDAASGHQGQLLTTLSAQNYALLSMRPRQAFDFTGRTGTIAYNVDAVTEGGLSWWTSLFVTDEPNPGASNTEQVTGEIPRNGVGFNIDDNCNTQGTQARISNVFTYSNYAETQIAVSNAVCFQTQRGSLNHIEVRLSQSNIQIWASDFSTDGGKTFPNFRMVGQAGISLPFSTGYVHFQQGERAPQKYASQFGISPGYANNYWSNLGFDGPVQGVETGYAVPDALTPNSNGGVNLGYGLLTSPNSTYTCCPQTTIGPLSVPNVSTSGVTSAKLTFSVYYTLSDGTHTAATIGLQYRLNGGTWHTPNPSPDYSKAFFCGTCPSPPGDANWSAAYSFPVAVSELKAGTNTIEIQTSGTSNGFPPVLANIDLLTFGGSATGGGPLPPTPTPVVTPSPTPGTKHAAVLGPGDSIQVTCTGSSLTVVTSSNNSQVLQCNP